ncbi:MAG: PepSY domain-containing protein, partial [Pseudomonas sp.]|uniref:PepSY domain-containing protein n=3 Tax=Pseudomonas TaxID=286 RepID=UPI003316345D
GLAIPSLDITSVSLPATAYSHIEMGGRGWYPLMFQSASVNPYTRQVDSQFLLSDRSALEFVTESMRPLHTGDFGGLPIKLIWFFFGLVLTLMVFSGLLIWTKRTAQATAATLKRSERATGGAHRETALEARP